MKYKGKFRLLPELDKETNDFPRDPITGQVDESYNDIYIACAYGNKITEYGQMPDNKKTMWLIAYIPSVVRGRNIKKILDEKNIDTVDYRELDFEVEFKFKAKDIDIVADLMKAKTGGANISPFSTRNLPKANVKIPTEEIEKYKAIVSVVQKCDLLLIHRITEDFLAKILQKKYKKIVDKSFDYKSDMRKMKMSRMKKEYIFQKGMWDEYLVYLKKEVQKFYDNK